MGAFAQMAERLFLDRNLAQAAVWSRPGGTTAQVRVILHRPDEIFEFGGARIVSSRALLDVRVAEVPDLAPGDSFAIGTDSWVVQGEPLRDAERLVWRAEVVLE
ncbi:head-tail joining protein [Jhaorihella thermophila]|uniref:Uncharacterized protein n=1 Tax=Jhaorihella thermophila TaxID=488547 RepID=A0A1H5Z523_9RHOB|nr:hypothetical protein [Jhaorihella thermophila]SEG31382.1 hypothetical protein SAMN05421751_12911 [Jhaorihella thermophila]